MNNKVINHNNTKNGSEPSNSDHQDPDFNGAALIDEEGNEIPITEDMILNACHSATIIQ